MNTPHPAPLALEHRVAAVELLLQNLVLVLETEKHFTGAKLDAWLTTARQHMAAHNSVPAEHRTALAALQELIAR